MARRPSPVVALKPVLADIARRFGAFPVPDGPLWPSDLQDAELRRFGLPSRPAATASPTLRRAWDHAFGQELTLVPFSLAASAGLIKEAPHPITARRLNVSSVPASPIDVSGNWAGAYLSANSDRRFTQVWGSWTVPDHLAVPPPGRGGVPGLPFMCSAWIGLDGQRRYLDSSLPQVGTASQMDAHGTVTARSWVQWWARDAPGNAPTWLTLPTAPGDRMAAVLTATGPQSVEAVLVNLRPPVPAATVVGFRAPSVAVGAGTATPSIAGATAEWIIERPSVPGTTRMFNFPDYGSSSFDMCVAVECDAVDLASLPGGIPQALHGVRLIRMTEVEAGPPPRSALLSLAERLSPTSVRVAYGGFGTP